MVPVAMPAREDIEVLIKSADTRKSLRLSATLGHRPGRCRDARRSRRYRRSYWMKQPGRTADGSDKHVAARRQPVHDPCSANTVDFSLEIGERENAHHRGAPCPAVPQWQRRRVNDDDDSNTMSRASSR